MEDTTIEFCPHCCNEVEIPADKPTNCPECGEVILPCNACEVHCDWIETKGCRRFPEGGKSLGNSIPNMQTNSPRRTRTLYPVRKEPEEQEEPEEESEKKMARCRKYGEEDCSMLLYITEDGEKKADGGMFQKHCYYCLETPHTKKIGHASQWSGSTPKWCPLGRD